MKQKNRYRTKGRAVFLVAIMIMSVFAVPIAFSGAAAADERVSDGDLKYQGQTIFADVPGDADATNPNYRLVRVSGDDRTTVSQLQVRNDSDGTPGVRVRTANRNTGNYEIVYNDGTNSSQELLSFTLLEQDLDVEIDGESTEVTVDNDGDDAFVDFEGESNRNEFDLNVTADGLDEEDLENIFDEDGNDFTVETDEDEDRITLVDFNSGDDYTVNFTDVDAGEYDFEFEVTDTGVSQTITVTVREIGEGELSFVDSAIEQEQGDIAEITVIAEEAANSGSLVIGDIDDVGYQLNVSIDSFDDDDEITIYFNTYLAGLIGQDIGDGDVVEYSDVIWTDESDGAELGAGDEDDELGNTESGVLDVGSYELTVSAETGADRFEETLDSPDEVGTLFLEERSTDSWATWTASDDAVDAVLDEDEDDRAEFAGDAIGSLITETDTVAHDDYIVHQFQASGLTGALEAMDSVFGAGDDADAQLKALLTTGEGDDDLANLRIRETRDSVGPNANRRTVNLENTSIDVVVDDENNQFFILMDTSDIVLGQANDEPNLDDEEDYEFDIRFELRDQRLLDVDEDDLDDNDLSDFYQRVDLENPVSIEEREGEFDITSDDQIEVNDEEGQMISGSTNIAPGSEVSIRLRGVSGASFSKSAGDLVVSPDGEFEDEFDFSDRNVDDEFEASLRNAGIDDRPEADGIVVEAVEEVDDDEMDDEEVDDEEVDDEPVDVDDEEVDDETEDDTPGFGALVAFLAVLGAAFLATRRQN